MISLQGRTFSRTFSRWLLCCSAPLLLFSTQLTCVLANTLAPTSMFDGSCIPKEECCAYCSNEFNTAVADATIRILTYEITGFDLMNMQKSADAYYEKTGIRVIYEKHPDFLGLYDEVRSQAELRLPLYDGYICGPAVVGSAVQLGGWMDLTDVVRDREDLKWLSVLRGFRENTVVYDGKVRMFPLDGDAHFMFYRSDVLEAFNQPIPRTWDEYWQVAKAVHGKEFKNKTLSGSCVGRKIGAHSAYWASLVLSSYTQTNGPTQGFILDSQDMSPLAGEAMAEAIKMLEFQAMYGHEDEFETPGGGDGDSINVNAMNSGECALTYNWGDSYKVSFRTDPVSIVGGLLQAAPSPGTTKVYNRMTKKLEPCTEETCGGYGGTFYDDIGWVNRAAYLAFGGWSAAINDNIDEAQKALITDYFVFMCSPETSDDAAVPAANASAAEGNGVDPFRLSHLNVEKWVAQGYERTSAETYMKAVGDTLNNPNIAIDMRFAGADLIYSAIEEETYNYLLAAVKNKTFPEDEDERQKIRLQVAERLDQRFREIIANEDLKPETIVPVLEQYQRDLGIYQPPVDESGNSTILYATVIPVMFAILVGAAVFLYAHNNKKYDDSVWQVKKEELIFSDPLEVIGQGSFGLVLLAEYRGTKVAVKRVLPPRPAKGTKSHKSNRSKSSFDGYEDASRASGGSDTYDNEFGIEKPKPKPEMNSKQMTAGFSSKASDMSFDKASRAGKGKSHRELKEELVKEMRYVSKLRHPCITTVMGVVISPTEEPMLIMEYMDHGSLYDILHNQSMVLEGEIILPMLRDITQGCRFLHASDPQVIHGDLKSANILVDSKFRAKVADFGLSHGKDTKVTGSPFFMAPELLRREAKNNTATDVYSFGIILYEVFSRKDPYEGEDFKNVLEEIKNPHIKKRPPIPHGCPPQLAAMMSDCLLESSEERPSFEELDKRLKRVDEETAAPTDQVKTSRDRSTVSLFDIFPKHIAEALRDGKKVEAEHKEAVTIFFCDIVGFTTISSTLDPRKVANLLDRLYQKFDTLSDSHDIFKVETIGDAYMAVTNLVKDQPDHAKRIAEFAVSAIKAANETLVDEEDPSHGCVNIRVGFHSGPVVADVVGSRNPRYCLFGDTVNTASRMESNSMANKIHCSEAAADFLIDQRCIYPLTPRGKIQVKGKGTMSTFWVAEDGGFISI